MNVQPAAGTIGIGLRHERRFEALRARRRLHDLLQEHGVIRRLRTSVWCLRLASNWPGAYSLLAALTGTPCSSAAESARPGRPHSGRDRRCRRRTPRARACRCCGSSGGCGAPFALARAVDQIEFQFQRRDRREFHFREKIEHALERRTRFGRIGDAILVAQGSSASAPARRLAPHRARSFPEWATPCRPDRRHRSRAPAGWSSRHARPSDRSSAESACRIRT